MGHEAASDAACEAALVLDRLGIAWEASLASACATPERVAEFARSASERGAVAIVVLGGDPGLAAAVVASSLLPVVLCSGEARDGDLFPTFPRGFPVAVVPGGDPGQAAALAGQIAALLYPDVRRRLALLRGEVAEGVNEANRRLQRALGLAAGGGDAVGGYDAGAARRAARPAGRAAGPARRCEDGGQAPLQTLTAAAGGEAEALRGAAAAAPGGCEELMAW